MKVLIAQLTLKIQSGRYHKTQYNVLCIKNRHKCCAER